MSARGKPEVRLQHLTPRESYCNHHLWVGAQEDAGLWEVQGPSTGDGPLAGEEKGGVSPGSRATASSLWAFSLWASPGQKLEAQSGLLAT